MLLKPKTLFYLFMCTFLVLLNVVFKTKQRKNNIINQQQQQQRENIN